MARCRISTCQAWQRFCICGTKLKSVQNGNVVEKTFRAGESVQQAILEKSNLQHTYIEGGDFVFMNMTSFEETRLSAEQIGKEI